MDNDYPINELARKAGVSVRTIRFYTEAGLLPNPPVQGRYSVYSEEYLERLELIRLLKERFLPLKEIRARLSGLSRADIQAALAKEKQAARGSQIAESGSNALDYIQRLRSSAPADVQRPPQPPGQPTPGQETWQRLRLAPGIELHIQQPVEPGAQRRLQQLLDAANRIFNL